MFKSTFFPNLWKLLKPYWLSDEKYLALGLLILTILCEMTQIAFAVKLSYWSKSLYDALQFFDKTALISLLTQFVWILIILILVSGYAGYFSSLLFNRYKRWLVKAYKEKWLLTKAYYLMPVSNQEVDNPDQRISDDLGQLASLSINLFIGFLKTLITLISFSVILWKLSGMLRLPYVNWVIPGYMFWAALLFSTVGTTITFKVFKNLVKLNYMQEKFSANFRYSLIHIRASAEQIAFYQGESQENNFLTYVFNFIFENSIKIIKITRTYTFFNSTYFNVINLLGILIALPRFFAEKLAVGILIQTVDAFRNVFVSFSFFVSSYPDIANLKAVINRLTEFNEKIAWVTQKKDKAIQLSVHTPSATKIKDLTLYLPEGQALITSLNLTINAGEKWLIQGKSGSGKTTLMRAMAGLWPYGEGEIILSHEQQKRFYPQRPYLPLTTLRNILEYPGNEQFENEKIKEILALCHLSHLFQKLDEKNIPWVRRLSLGEQQRIVFAQVLLQKPDWVFFDEITSALDEELESILYQLLVEKLPHLTLISIAHRRTLMHFHENILKLDDYKLG
ncbi:MAG: Vitamin B12 transport ATP-binding protein BacA [Legionellaceae bacterium]